MDTISGAIRMNLEATQGSSSISRQSLCRAPDYGQSTVRIMVRVQVRIMIRVQFGLWQGRPSGLWSEYSPEYGQNGVRIMVRVQLGL